MSRTQAFVSVLPDALKRCFKRTLMRTGYQLMNIRKIYDFDGLLTVHNASFREDPRFQAAYKRGLQATWGVNPRTEWRIHVGLWAASMASRAPGDFVECGVNAGFLSSAILNYLDWNNLDRKFYLVDTFEGPVLTQFSKEEIDSGRLAVAQQALSEEAYVTDLERVRRNYSEWHRIEIVKGSVPEVLPAVDTRGIAFLHLDMNCANPEAAALRHFWPHVASGGIVLFDDYAYFGYEAQGIALGEIAAALGAEILVLPTGQGLIVK